MWCFLGYGSRVLDRWQRPLKSLRLSVTDRCNLRCSYCMPEAEYRWLPKRELLDFDELSRLCDAFAAAGVDRVRITGGEPLMRRDLHELVARIAQKAAIVEVALTTNGVLLADQAARLAGAGLDRVTVSLDTLRPERFERITRRAELDAVLAGIEAARAAGLDRGLKIDAVVIAGENDDELCDLLAFGRSIDAEVRFIEYMDVGGATRWAPERVVSRDDMLASIAAQLPGCHIAPLSADGAARGSAPAERFALTHPDGQRATFGIIASTTRPFCAACDRSRVTADGSWYHCLYATRGVDLKAPLRAGASVEALSALIGRHWSMRDDRGAEARARLAGRGSFVPVEALRADPRLEMHTRGG